MSLREVMCHLEGDMPVSEVVCQFVRMYAS